MRRRRRKNRVTGLILIIVILGLIIQCFPELSSDVKKLTNRFFLMIVLFIHMI